MKCNEYCGKRAHSGLPHLPSTLTQLKSCKTEIWHNWNLPKLKSDTTEIWQNWNLKQLKSGKTGDKTLEYGHSSNYPIAPGPSCGTFFMLDSFFIKNFLQIIPLYIMGMKGLINLGWGSFWIFLFSTLMVSHIDRQGINSIGQCERVRRIGGGGDNICMANTPAC